MTSVAIHVDQLYYRVPGGIGDYVRGLVTALRTADPELAITLFHARFDRSPPEGWMTEFPMKALRHRMRALYPSWALTGRPVLPASLSAADLVHGPSPAAVPPPGEGQRLVVTVHDLAFRIYPSMFPPSWRNLFRLGLRRAAKVAAALLVPSESTARDLVRLTAVQPRRVHVVPHASTLPLTEDDPAAVLDRMKVPTPYVLFVGTLEPRKNVVRLVRAYRRAMAASALPHALVLAGPLGWQAQPLHRELALGGPGQVVLTGRTSPEELDVLYRGAAVLAYPSLYEGFGLPVLEAMARGVPVIASTASSLPELAGDAALAVEPKSVSALAGALERVLTDPREGRRLVAAGRKRAREFSWERTARGTLAAYESVI